MSGVGCGFCLWLFLDFSIYLFDLLHGRWTQLSAELWFEWLEYRCIYASLRFTCIVITFIWAPSWENLFYAYANNKPPFWGSWKYERNGSHAKLTWHPSGVTYFARDPLHSYFHEPQKNEIYFLSKVPKSGAVWSGWRSSLIRVCTVCHSVCVFWTHCSTIKHIQI